MLHALIYEELAKLDTPDPHDIADRVADRLPEDELRDALRETLPALVQSRIRTTNYSELGKPGKVAAPATQPKASRSAKVGAVRESWRPFLNKPHYAGTEWKTLGLFTREDAENAAQYRHKLAEGNTRKAEWYETLSKKLSERGVETLKDLSDADLDEIEEHSDETS